MNSAAEQLEIERAGAWFKYLERIRRARVQYDDVEPWAWRQLQVRLASIDERAEHLASTKA